MDSRLSLAESLWLVVVTATMALLNCPGVEGNTCPSSYPFYSCPRPGDLTKDTVCCMRSSRYSCCTPEYIQGWGIALIVVGCIFFTTLITVSICLCCRKRKRQEYTIIRDNCPQPHQHGVIVVSAPPPPPGQYGYSAMAYPPSNVSLPPPYQSKPPVAQSSPRQQGNELSENEEDAV
ncbi:cysteine and tyrosine-rich protein 1-like [Acanthaster planci]|uniref:Cysteine and tyrosine-rich protein 1-like n=1 Tax=Acanthaster planci TaxID=133434 RepID=A0A8B7ZB97_ACAPL|nr:cysteine and tyrosine-rich protein 1-like [Acanthaster planci]